MLSLTEEAHLDSVLDCSVVELAERRRIRASDRAYLASVRRHHRWQDLSPKSKAELERRHAARMDIEHAEWRAEMLRSIAAKSPFEITLEELESLPMGDRLKVELTIMMAHKKREIEMPSNVIPLPIPQQVMPLPTAQSTSLIQSSGDFVAGFSPPDYLVDGVLQRRFAYSLTAQTGTGKTAVAMRLAAHVATGRSLGNIDVQQGTVLYFAGENPTDVRMRWLGLTHAMGLNPDELNVHFIEGVQPLSSVAEQITLEVVAKGLSLALVVVDTAMAYFEGDDLNGNVFQRDHAQRLRSLTLLNGGPAVLVLAHPTKHAKDNELIPAGGGAFLNEIDGNIALRKDGQVLGAEALGKFRGPEFGAMLFELKVVKDHPLLIDSRGRRITTVIAEPTDERAPAQSVKRKQDDELAVLRIIDQADRRRVTPTEIAVKAGWTTGNPPTPYHKRASRILDRLKKEKLVEDVRGAWSLSSKGQRYMNDLTRQPEFPDVK